MKRFFCLLFVLVFLPVVSLADQYLFAHYSLFIDGEFYNSIFNAGFNFDTQVFNLYLYNDFIGGIFHKVEWVNGERKDYGDSSFTYVKGSPYFTIVYSDGSSMRGFWDDNDDDIWINLGGNSVFRFCPVHSFDIQKDMVNK